MGCTDPLRRGVGSGSTTPSVPSRFGKQATYLQLIYADVFANSILASSHSKGTRPKISPEVAFTIISIYVSITAPFVLVPMGLTAWAQFNVAMDRCVIECGCS